MGANGRQVYLARYSEKTVVTRLVRLLEEIVLDAGEQ
jgi:hypothetical protein